MRGKWHSCVASRRDSQRLSGSCERSYRNCASVQKTSIKWEESHGKSRTDPKHWPLKSLAIENSWVGYRISKKCRMLKHVETCWNLLKHVETWYIWGNKNVRSFGTKAPSWQSHHPWKPIAFSCQHGSSGWDVPGAIRAIPGWKSAKNSISNGTNQNGGFLKWGYPKWMVFVRENP